MRRPGSGEVPPNDEVTLPSVPEVLPPVGTPEGRRSGHLIVLKGASVGNVFSLKGDCVAIGRDDTSGVVLADPGVSRRHAEVVCEPDGSYWLRDCGSRNGTYLNAVRITERTLLHENDRLQIGLLSVLRFTLDEGIEASYARAMYDAALRDPLTGVFNRRYFDQRLPAEFSFARRQGSALALMLVDLDHFKRVNDTYGHLVGDQVLRQVGSRLLRAVRAEDVVMRYGGEEFAVLSRGANAARAEVVAERMRLIVANEPFVGEPALTLQLTVSAGVSVMPHPSIDDPQTLVAAADEALYQAKALGRNRVAISGGSHHPEASAPSETADT
ncbi:MAG: GGDEF domain-containing protein [Proteobacteria bacterium]|nr:GGDEF domain-containing protein [Pseudomonadota bacterium]